MSTSPTSSSHWTRTAGNAYYNATKQMNQVIAKNPDSDLQVRLQGLIGQEQQATPAIMQHNNKQNTTKELNHRRKPEIWPTCPTSSSHRTRTAGNDCYNAAPQKTKHNKGIKSSPKPLILQSLQVGYQAHIGQEQRGTPATTQHNNKPKHNKGIKPRPKTLVLWSTSPASSSHRTKNSGQTLLGRKPRTGEINSKLIPTQDRKARNKSEPEAQVLGFGLKLRPSI